MLRQSIILLDQPLFLLARDISACVWITNYIIAQCIIVVMGAMTIHFCWWSPERSTMDYDKLARMMYLYDPHACGYNLRTSASIINVRLSNYTYGLNVLPIQWMPADITVTTRLSAKTRRYIHFSVFLHIIWMSATITLRLFKSNKKTHFLKMILNAFFYTTSIIIIFDVSMAIVYTAHIQQSLTKGMILRYSGWSVEMKLDNYNDFGGWMPLAAAACWMRGLVFFSLNVYCCRFVGLMTGRLQKREVRKRLMLKENEPIPEPDIRQPIDRHVLYFKKGEHKPVIRGISSYFYRNE